MAALPKTLTYDGQTLTLREWAACRSISFHTIASRLKAGMSVHDVLSKCNHRHRNRKSRPSVEKTRTHRRLNRSNPWTLDAPRPSLGHRCFLTVDGVTHSHAEWSVIKGITVSVIAARVRKGDAPEQVLRPMREPTKPSPRPRPFVYTRMTLLSVDHETRTVERWGYELRIPVAVMLSRLKVGEPAFPGAVCAAGQGAERSLMNGRPPRGAMRVPTLAEVDAMRRAA